MNHLLENLNLLVVEDDPNFLHLLSLLLRDAGVPKIHTAANYESGLGLFQAQVPDVCILDIDLGKNQKSGIALAEAIRLKAPSVPIIYLTAHYTEEFYESCRHTLPVCFLNKELSRFKIQMALDFALMHKVQIEKALPLHPPVLPSPPPIISSQQFFFKIGDVYKAIPIKDICYFFAESKLTFARVGQRNYPTNVLLKTLEEELSSSFVRIHKTFLVNLNFIEMYQPKENSVIIDGESLPIGYAYRKGFLERLPLLK